MADLLQGLYAYLQTQTGVTNLVSDRVYPDQAPSNTTLPYITYYQQDSEKPRNLESASALAQDTISVLLYGESRLSVQTLSEAVRNALYGRKNIDFPQTSGSLDVRSISWLGQTASYEPPTDASEQAAYVLQVDLLISWVEPKPTLP